jgi:truncated hemoglobin YjbI
LVVPAGMTEESRRDWLTVAWGTLKNIPGDLLERGCAHARKVADHPAKIVPAIMAEVEQAWKWRREHRSRREGEAPQPMSRERQIEQGLDPDQVDEWNAIMARAGASTRYRPDGSRYEAETSTQARQDRGPPRKPTRADYIALGCSEADLDGMGIR